MEQNDNDGSPLHAFRVLTEIYRESVDKSGMAFAFCCPECLKQVSAVLTRRARERQEAKDALEAACAHDYEQRGLLAQCTKCKRWK